MRLRIPELLQSRNKQTAVNYYDQSTQRNIQTYIYKTSMHSVQYVTIFVDILKNLKKKQ